MRQSKSVKNKFYKGVPLITGNGNDLPGLNFEELASVSMEAVYVLDFFKRDFHFVANHDFFLCGHSVEEALCLGYDFFSKIIHEDDLLLLAEIHAAILIRLCDFQESHSINYFSFTVRIKNRVGYIMVYHKLKPLYVNGLIRYGLCLLSSSVLDTPGHLCVHYSNSSDFDQYSTTDKRWQKNTKQEPLSDREKDILKLLKQGKANDEIATNPYNPGKPRKHGILPISTNTLQHDLSSIYKKLNVKTRMQAVIKATNRHSIFSRGAIPEKKEKEAEIPEKIKLRRKMTPEKLTRIQVALNKGQSVNSIANQEGISESTIRYHISKGKLKKLILETNS